MMFYKFVHRFLACWMLFQFTGMAALPCMDEPCSEEQLTHTSQHSHEETTDGCSPLCSCDCCPSPISVAFSMDFYFRKALEKAAFPRTLKAGNPMQKPYLAFQPPEV